MNNSILKVASVQVGYELEYSDYIWKAIWDDQYKEKILKILDFLKGKVDCIIFPELSIPFELIGDLKTFTDSEKIIVIAGSHYVERKNITEYSKLFENEIIKDRDFRKSICPVLVPGKKIFHIEKVNPSRDEDVGYEEPGMTQGEIQAIFSIGNYNLGILICSDFLSPDIRSRILKKAHILFVPQFNGKMDRFYEIADYEFQNPNNVLRTILLVNATGNSAAGGSAIFKNIRRSDQKKSQEQFGYNYATLIVSDKTKEGKLKLLKDELIIISHINLEDTSERTPSAWTKYKHPIDYQIVPILKIETELINLLENIKKANEVEKCMELIEVNLDTIRKSSSILFNNTKELENLRLNEIKRRCQAVII